MPFSLPTSISTTQRYIPAVTVGEQVKIAGVGLHFATLAALNAAVANERLNIADGLGLWLAGTPLRNAAEPAGVVRLWTLGTGGSDAANAAASHARTIVFPSGATVTASTDAAAVLATTGAPAGGTGAVNDVAFDRAAGLAYTKTGSTTWDAGVSVGSGPSVALANNTTTATPGTAALDAAVGPQIAANTAAIARVGVQSGVQRLGGVASIGRSIYMADSTGLTNAENGYTQHHTVVLPPGVTAIRFAIVNDLANSWVVPSAAVAALASVAPGAAVWTAAGVTWRPVTWGGATSVTIPARLAAARVRQSITWSDWIPVTPIARTDGGSGSVFGIRVRRPTDTAVAYQMIPGVNSTLNDLYESGAGNYLVRTYAQNVDGITTPSAFTSNSHNSFSLVAAVQGRTFASCATVAAIGDSTSQGDPSSSPARYLGWLVPACAAASTLARPVVPLNLGFSGQNAAEFLAQLPVWVAEARPTICIIQPWSQNDGITTEAQREVMWDKAVVAAAAVRQYGGTPLFLTPLPSGAMTATQEARRREIVALVKASGIGYIDFDAVATLYDSPSAGLSTYKAGYSADGVHPNESTGYPALAAAASAAITAVLA